MANEDVMFSVVKGDALTVEADVLILKYAQRPYGLDQLLVGRIEEFVTNINDLLPKPGKSLLVESYEIISARKILFLGVKPLYQFQYEAIREFAFRGLQEISIQMPDVKHIAVTVHGVNYGLDEAESLKSQMAGFLEAIETGNAPHALERVSIIERASDRAERLAVVLNGIVPQIYSSSEIPQSDDLRTAGRDSVLKPHIFVAMPFLEEMDDIYQYGIYRPVTSGTGFICERADLSSFTGDVLSWVKSRIASSALVIAELSGANPNVYLEVGYAWGLGKPTLLLVKNTDELKFDVRSQRCLVYKKIQDLEDSLMRELRGLSIKAAGT